jgi:hypothetical protein
MPHVGPPDPLGTTANPRCYVPLPSTERAISALRAGVCAQRSPLILLGPAGAGKTLVLRVLAEQEAAEGRRVVFSPFLHFAPAELTRWLLHLAGVPCPGAGTGESQLIEALRGGSARPTLLLVDEAQSASAAALQQLAKLAEAAGPRLLLVAAARSTRSAPELGRAEVTSLPAPLPAPEMRRLCDGLLAQRGAPVALAALAPREREALIDAAHGVPALLVLELLRRGSWRPGPHEAEMETALRAKAPTERSRAIPVRAADRARPPARLARGAVRWRRPALAALAAQKRARRRGRTILTLALRQVERGASVAAVAVSALRTRVLLDTDRGRHLARAALCRGGDVLAHLVARAIDWSEAWDVLDGPMWRQLDRAVRRGVQGSTSWVHRQWEAMPRRAQQARLRADEWRARARVHAVGASAWIRGRWAWVGVRAVPELKRLAAQLALSLRSEARVRLRGFEPLAPRALAAAGITMVALYAGGVRETAASFQSLAIPEISAPARSPVEAVSSTTVAAAARLRVRVNARPWAWIRVDGVKVGATPLSHLRLEPGPHEFEAEFADGRRSQRTIVIASDDTAVSLRSESGRRRRGRGRRAPARRSGPRSEWRSEVQRHLVESAMPETAVPGTSVPLEREEPTSAQSRRARSTR